MHHTEHNLYIMLNSKEVQVFPHNLPKVKVKVTQQCPTLCYPMDYTVHGILQARILEWVAFPFSRGSMQPRDQTQVSHTAAEPLGKSSCQIYKRQTTASKL